MAGNGYFFSPEYLKGDYTEKCDIWSAGVILYIFLSGEPPFNDPNELVIHEKFEKVKLIFPEKKWSKISKDAKDLICHMLVPEKERYTSKQVLKHLWFKNANNSPLPYFNFNITFFKEYNEGSALKKIILFISSSLAENEINNLKQLLTDFDKCKDGQITYDKFK